MNRNARIRGLPCQTTGEPGHCEGARRLRVTAQRAGGGADLEFVAAPQGAENLEDRIAVLDSRGASESSEQDFSLRLLRHFASRHPYRRPWTKLLRMVEERRAARMFSEGKEVLARISRQAQLRG